VEKRGESLPGKSNGSKGANRGELSGRTLKMGKKIPNIINKGASGFRAKEGGRSRSLTPGGNMHRKRQRKERLCGIFLFNEGRDKKRGVFMVGNTPGTG